MGNPGVRTLDTGPPHVLVSLHHLEVRFKGKALCGAHGWATPSRGATGGVGLEVMELKMSLEKSTIAATLLFEGEGSAK